MSLYSVGEIAECLFNDRGGWHECTVEAIDVTGPYGEHADYLIFVPSIPCKHFYHAPNWGVDEQYLRKKRPPQQDNQVADDEFIDDFLKHIVKQPEKLDVL